MRMSPAAFLLPLAALYSPLAAQSKMDAVVTRAMKEFHVPGVAVALVKDGKVVTKGYGVRKLGDAAPITPHTRFGIASNSKVFTAAALAMLVDEGKLAWDDRVVDRLPGFQMSDAYVTREMRIRDLLCHRSGLALGAGDLMFWPATNLSAEDILYRLRFVPLATSFRNNYAYDNILYNVAGAVLKQVGGHSWADTMHERFFQPLGMKDSLTSVVDLKPDDDVVAPHAMSDGKLVPLAHQPLDNNAPAGAIVSSADDLAKWAQVLLNEGDLGGGKRLFSAAQARTLQRPLTILGTGVKEGPLKEATPTLAAYAMGLEVQDYRGHKMVWHTGGLAGMVSRVTLLPEEKAAVIVLTNAESGEAFQAITNTLLDEVLGAPAKDWVAAYSETLAKQKARVEEAVKQGSAKRDTTSKPSLPLASYAGRYRDPWYGDVFLEMKEDRLHIRFSHSPALTAPLEHWQHDTFVARWPDRSMDADAFVTFSLNPDGSINRIAMRPVSPSTDFSYDFQHLALTPVATSAPAF